MQPPLIYLRPLMCVCMCGVMKLSKMLLCKILSFSAAFDLLANSWCRLFNSKAPSAQPARCGAVQGLDNTIAEVAPCGGLISELHHWEVKVLVGIPLPKM